MIDYKELEDSAVVMLAKVEDKHAFGELYERYITRIYNYVYYRTGNHQDAEDLTARVFMRAMSHIKTYDERGVPFSAWLYRIAHNLVANWYRDHNRRKIITLEDYSGKGDQASMPEEIFESEEEHQRLLDSIQQLPEERQQLLILKYVERLSNAEIGVVMNRTGGAVKSLYYRTLSYLREELNADHPQQQREAE